MENTTITQLLQSQIVFLVQETVLIANLTQQIIYQSVLNVLKDLVWVLHLESVSLVIPNVPAALDSPQSVMPV